MDVEWNEETNLRLLAADRAAMRVLLKAACHVGVESVKVDFADGMLDSLGMARPG